jgi:hypothetical protein
LARGFALYRIFVFNPSRMHIAAPCCSNKDNLQYFGKMEQIDFASRPRKAHNHTSGCHNVQDLQKLNWGRMEYDA